MYAHIQMYTDMYDILSYEIYAYISQIHIEDIDI